MREISLTRGQKAIVDDKDHDWLTALGKWCISAHGYAVKRDKRSGKVIRMHHLILGWPPEGMVTDRIDLNRLNNQRANLRFLSHSDSVRNRNLFKRSKHSSIRYKGVSRTAPNRWRAYLTVNGANRHIGCFDSPEQAAQARDKEAQRLYGNRIKLNFPIVGSESGRITCRKSNLYAQ